MRTPSGQSALRKINARTFEELSIANSLMRLGTANGKESLVDRFIRYKNDSNAWENDMVKYGLTDLERKALHELLDVKYGICDTQEYLMLVTMEPSISAFTLAEANGIRKAMASKKYDKLKIYEELFFQRCEENKTSEAFTKYVWEELITPQLGYSFSAPHVVGYTLIAMIEMNICYRFDPIYWQAACLTVDSGLSEDSSEGVKYDKLAVATGVMRDKITPPSINVSAKGFTPDVKNGTIKFGLTPIVGLGDKLIDRIIELRPYASFNDFYDKFKEEPGFTDRIFVILIKSGAFDEFEADRRKLMIEYINLAITPKEKLTMVQLPKVLETLEVETLSKYREEIDLFEFRKRAFPKGNKPLDKETTQEFISKYSKKEIVMKNGNQSLKYDFDDNGNLKIDRKQFDKYFERNTLGLRELLSTQEAIDALLKKDKRQFWIDNCLGTVESWSMKALAYYNDKHEFEGTNINELYTLSDFNEMEETPVPIEVRKWGKRNIYIYAIKSIAGTVVSKEKNKGLLSILTETGIVRVKYNRDQFAFYNKKDVETVDGEKVTTSDSWFNRGDMVVIHGYRQGETFIPKVYKNTGYENTTQKLQIQNKKVFVTFNK